MQQTQVTKLYDCAMTLTTDNRQSAPTAPAATTAPETVGVNIKLSTALHKRLRVYCVTHDPELYMADVVTAALEAYL
jgi:hypothetical protein